jgi:hypothetical protein
MSADGSAAETSPRLSLTDSPWFWVYLFGTAALVALFLAGNKYGLRQAQIEREAQGRLRATQALNGQEPSLKLSTPDNTIITLQPLWFLIAVLTVAGWFLFWRSRRSAGTAVTQPMADLSSQGSSSSSQHHVDSGQSL